MDEAVGHMAHVAAMTTDGPSNRLSHFAHDLGLATTYRLSMSTRSDSTTATRPAFSFATSSPWVGPDAETLRIHTRARLVQLNQRATRIRRQNLALEHLLQVAQAHRRVEQSIALGNPDIIDLRERREKRYDAKRVEASKETQRIIELRDRAALLDLRRQHEDAVRDLLSDDAMIDLRAPYPILRDSQPRSAVASRRWG